MAGVPGLWFRPRHPTPHVEDAVPARRRLHRDVAEHVLALHRASPAQRIARSSSPTTGSRRSSPIPPRSTMRSRSSTCSARREPGSALPHRRRFGRRRPRGKPALRDAARAGCARPRACCSSHPRSAWCSTSRRSPRTRRRRPAVEHPDELVPARRRSARRRRFPATDVTAWPPTFIAYGGDEIFRDPIRASRRSSARSRRADRRARAAGNVPCLPGARAVGGVEPGDVHGARRVRRPHH